MNEMFSVYPPFSRSTVELLGIVRQFVPVRCEYDDRELMRCFPPQQQPSCSQFPRWREAGSNFNRREAPEELRRFNATLAQIERRERVPSCITLRQMLCVIIIYFLEHGAVMDHVDGTVCVGDAPDADGNYAAVSWRNNQLHIERWRYSAADGPSGPERPGRFFPRFAVEKPT